MGSGTAPKEIPEAAQYALIQLEIESQNGARIYVLERSLRGGDIQLSTEGGADRILNAHFYGPPAPPDPLGRTAGHEQGAASIAIGIAAEKSIRDNRPVDISDVAPLDPAATRLSQLV